MICCTEEGTDSELEATVHHMRMLTLTEINAIKIIENHSEICLLVTDWRMPKMNGLELTKKVTEIDHEIKAMLMSAYDLEEDQLKEINKNDYLRKPIHMNKLIDAVKKEVYGTITA